MNSKFFTILAAATVMAMSSCSKVIDFTGEFTDPELVMVSEAEADSVWHIKVTQSKFFLGYDTIATVKNATFDISVNGTPVSCSPVHEGGGVYNTGVVPHCGDSISVHVNVPGRKSIYATCRIPAKPVISNFHIEWDTTHYTNQWTDNYGETYYEGYASGQVRLKFHLHDPAGERNYYMVRISYDQAGYHGYQNFWIDDDVLYDYDASEEVFDLDLADDLSQSDDRGRVFFTDDRINGQEHSLTAVLNYYESYDRSTYYDNMTLNLEVYSISRDLYLYWRTVRAAADNDEVFTQIISEPVQVHCNVVDGIGILGGMAATRYTIGTLGPQSTK